MEIEELKIFQIRVPLTVRAAIASGEYEYTDSVIVELTTDEDISGFGEAVIDPHFTGETFGSIVYALKHYYGPAIIGMDVFDIVEIHEKMNNVLVHNTSAKCAVDLACYDIIGKATGKPVYKILGGALNKEISEVEEVVLGSIDEVVEKCIEAVNSGVKSLKIKVGEGLPEDEEKVRRIREAVGSDIEIRVDANQGWGSYWKALKVIRKLEKYDVSVVEQPLPAGDLKGTAMLRKKTNVLIMLDESIHTVKDAKIAIELDACDIISIKIMKAGGILPSKELAEYCNVEGIPCHMGTSWETEIGWAANLHLITALKNIRLWDAYSPTEIYWGLQKSVGTPIKSYVKNGVKYVEIPKGNGLGIEIYRNVIKELQISEPVIVKG